MAQLSYSPDLGSYDFFPFSKLRYLIKGIRLLRSLKEMNYRNKS